MSRRTWTNEQLILAVETSKTKSEVIRKLGLSSKNPGNFDTINRWIKKLSIDMSHFLGKAHGTSRTPLAKEFKEILVENSDYVSSPNLKTKLLKAQLIKEICAICSCPPIWQNSKLILQLDHINGCRTDNRLENLRLLCPNCHSQTQTFCRGQRRKNKKHCVDCSKPVSAKATRCHACAAKLTSHNKIVWPAPEKVKDLVIRLGYVATGKILGVNDNSVRKFLLRNGIVISKLSG